jgi:hypothetical protein
LPIKPVDRGSFLAIGDIDKQILCCQAFCANAIALLQWPAIFRNRLIRWLFSLHAERANGAGLRAHANSRNLANAAVWALGRTQMSGGVARKK